MMSLIRMETMKVKMKLTKRKNLNLNQKIKNPTIMKKFSINFH